MKSKKWKGSKSVLPLLLSAMLVVEPLGSAITVHAEEMVPAVEAGIDEQEENVNVGETILDSGEVEDTNNEAENHTEQDENNQETNVNSESEAVGDDEISDVEDDDQKDEHSEGPSDTENQETDENVPLEDVSVSENELGEASVSENDIDEEQDSDTEQFTDMPEKYQLTTAQRIEKEVLAGEVPNINEADEGVLYVKGQYGRQCGKGCGIRKKQTAGGMAELLPLSICRRNHFRQ